LPAPLTALLYIMKRVLPWLAAALLLAAGFPALGSSVFHPLTPGNLQDERFRFQIGSKKEADGSVGFTVVVSGKSEDFVSPGAGVSMVTLTATSEEIKGASVPEQEVKTPTSITCTFTVPAESLKDPDLCYVFANYVQMLVNGKMAPMPAVDFYYARLKDFAK